MSERLSDQQLLSLINQAGERIRVDGSYIHTKSGAEYNVAGFAFIESTMELNVMYYSPYLPDVTFVRPLESFLEKFE